MSSKMNPFPKPSADEIIVQLGYAYRFFAPKDITFNELRNMVWVPLLFIPIVKSSALIYTI